MMIFSIALPLPPSSNKTHRRRGLGKPGLFLTPAAKRYKRSVIKAVLAKCVHTLKYVDPESAYFLTLVFHLDAITKGYPGKAKHRFRIIDLSNRVILLENAIKEVTGIDDSNTFELNLIKVQLREGESPYVEAHYGKLEEVDWRL